MFDTHCHLNFSRFDNNRADIIKQAHQAGVSHLLVPGIDLESSNQAITLTQQNDSVFAAAGIHPSAIESITYKNVEHELKRLLMHPTVLAVGEVGLDTPSLEKTPLSLQTEWLIRQIKLAIDHHRSLIIHNRGLSKQLLTVLEHNWHSALASRTVFHCCEPDKQLLLFAKKNHVFIGVNGDVTYDEQKQQFIAQVPLELLVLETDAPFLLPEPLRSEKKYPNVPANLPLIAKKVAHIKGIELELIVRHTTQNAFQLFGITQ